jgi:hypothetical protein
MAAVKVPRERARAARGARRLGVAAFLAVFVAAQGARAGCPVVRIATERAPLAPDWQAAVVDLIEQTRRPGTPWSCAGGALLLRFDDDDRAVLRFRDLDGNSVERHIPSPSALVATAEALLARPAPHEASPPASTPPVDEIERALERPPPDDDSAHRIPARPRGEPRYIVDATVGVRFSGPDAALWIAPELRATVPLDAWSVGVWIRYGIPHVFQVIPPDFAMSQVNLGFSGGRQLLSAPIDLRVAFNPSFSVISMDGDPAAREVSGAKIDFYLGAGLSAAIPFSPVWRGVVVLDAELAPAAIRAERRIDPSFPALPAYELGLAFGVELVAR